MHFLRPANKCQNTVKSRENVLKLHIQTLSVMTIFATAVY